MDSRITININSGNTNGCDGNGEPESKTTLCHIPPGNPENPQTIEVPDSAVGAHLRHGDTLGSCPESIVDIKEGTTVLLHEDEEIDKGLVVITNEEKPASILSKVKSIIS